METYDTVTGALSGLKAKGYSLDFNIGAENIQCAAHDIVLHPDEFEITEVHRFEGDTNPSDEEVLYAVQSKDGVMKGTIVSAFGMYADTLSNEMIQKLSIHH
jgi:hypothetical protein